MAKISFNQAAQSATPPEPAPPSNEPVFFDGEDYTDPFQQESTPAVSFRDAAVGDKVVGVVTKPAQLVQSRVFETGALAFWPDGNPKMSAVVSLNVDGELRSLWAAKPSAMFSAVASETKRLGRALRQGDTLEITFTGTKPNAKNPKLNPQKLYAVKVIPAA
jgi:hypothetical protein